MYYYPEPSFSDTISASSSLIWTIVSLVIAIIGGICVYFLVIKPNRKMSNHFLEKAKIFFNFGNMLIEDILKIAYLILTIFITLSSISLISTNFFGFIFTLILGNLGLRIIFELCLINIMIWKNTNEINKKIQK